MTALRSVKPDVAGTLMRPALATVKNDVSHNLNGQKLGRKGRITRERILAATLELLNEGSDTAISLSAVARRASLGMTSLYLYFADLTELLLAVLEPVKIEAEAEFLEIVKNYWPDDRLEEFCRNYIESYFAFWVKHSRILHLRNSMADQYDERMIAARVRSARMTITLFRRQLSRDSGEVNEDARNMASVLATAIERAVTVATDPLRPDMIARQFGPRDTNVVEPLTRLLVLAIADSRSRF